jgi:2-(1,2-epoxy-1,2-dihydrophenyl)acetyl-CoA isomerase
VAAESASFIQAFSKIGLVPDTGGTFILPRLIGWQKASALMMLGEKVSASEAEKLGMIYKIFPDTNFAQEAFAIATTLAKMPTKGLAYTKQVLNNSFNNNFEEQLLEENIFQQKAALTEDYKEGTAAFLGKRTPLFTGK